MELFNLKNIHYDENSRHTFQELNESLFIEKFFHHLLELLGDSFSHYEFFVFSHQGKDKYPNSIEFKTDRKKVLFYFSDELGVDPEPYAHRYFAVFKAYIGTTPASTNVFPMNLGYVRDVPELPIIPFAERSTNVFYRGNLNSNRIGFYRSFSRWKYLIPYKNIKIYGFYTSFLLKLRNDFSHYFPKSIIFFNKGFKKGFKPEEYGKVLAESKIVLCPKGFDSTECFRHMEAMRAGCIIVSEKLPAIEFYLNSPIIEIENWTEGLRKVKRLLSDESKMEAIHRETVLWWKNKCSEEATAKYIFNKLSQLEKEPEPLSAE